MDSCFQVQEWQLKVWKQKEKLIEFISLPLIYMIVNEDNGSAMAMCILIALGKKNLSWLGVIGREMQAVPCQVCLPSTSAVISYAHSVASPVIPLSAHLTWWTCLANPSGGGRSGKWGSLLWVIGKKKLLASHTLQLFILLPPSLIIMIIHRKENEWLGDVILWVCG